jgi:hypothetical protein
LQLVLFLVHRFLSAWWRRRQVPPKRRFLQEPHGVTTQKTAFFIVTAVNTSNLTCYPCLVNISQRWVCRVSIQVPLTLEPTYQLILFAAVLHFASFHTSNFSSHLSSLPSLFYPHFVTFPSCHFINRNMSLRQTNPLWVTSCLQALWCTKEVSSILTSRSLSGTSGNRKALPHLPTWRQT